MLAGGALAADVQTAVTERVSVSSSEAQGNNISGRFSTLDLSGGGSFVAFDSLASNLVAGDGNNAVDVFVRDRAAGTTERVSIHTNGTQGNSASDSPSISTDGRFVAFDSDASNLVPGDGNFSSDVFVRDRMLGTTTRVSVSSDEVGGDEASFGAAISADGRYIAFASDATNLVPGKTMFPRDIYVRDLQAGTTEIVSLTDGEGESNSSSAPPDISPDGRYVAFGSFASNLVQGDGNDAFDVFVRDRQAGTTVRASVSSNEEEGTAPSTHSAISAGGAFVAFASDAPNLVPGDLNERTDVFVRDLQAGTTERVSVSSSEQEGDSQSNGPGIRGGFTFGPRISDDGRFVVFDSIAKNLVPGDTNACDPNFQEPGRCPDVFVRDRTAGTTVRVSLATDGTQGDHASTDPAISPDGLTFGWFSSAGNLVPGDTNTCPPIFFDPGECPDMFVRTADQGGGGADLGVAQTDAPDPVVVGQRVTYTVEVTNHGPSGATGVKLVDTLPRTTRFISATPSRGTCSRVRRKLTCTIGNLAIGASSGASATVAIVVRANKVRTISNQAVVSGNEPDPNPGNNTDTEQTTVVPA